MKLSLKNQCLFIVFILFFDIYLFAQENLVSPDKAKELIIESAKKISVSPINELPLHNNGRIKPLDTLARESLLFISGSYTKFGLDPVQLYLALIVSQHSEFVEILEVRDKDLRTELGFLKNKKFYSLKELESSNLNQRAEPLYDKQQNNSRSLNEHEKNILETHQQQFLLRDLISGQNIMMAADYNFLNKNHGQENPTHENETSLQSDLKSYFQSLNQDVSLQQSLATKLLQTSSLQKAPELFQHYLKKIKYEIFYNHFRPFLWASMLSLLLGIAFFTPLYRIKISKKLTIYFLLIPTLFIFIGLSLRVYITQFAPITNMYGTMVWVSFGITIFGLILYSLYMNYTIPGITLIASGLLLTLTEQVPLVLSPDLDPIVAVLRSNFWLSTHVTTITISYAAFTIAMVLGNIALVRLWFFNKENNTIFFKEYSHYAYRMIQLGCFLLSVGIILGGIWADYSWGRFWGWDPKETWALIADLGFLMILHGKYAGWITPFTLLAWSPVAYLLVVMAWYGVNFILAAGLHSYGFSSGGALAVLIFVVLQILLLLAGLTKFQILKQQLRE